MSIRSLVPQPVRSFLKRFLCRNSVTIAQAGQDCWVYGEAFNEKRGGYFLDIGAHDGMSISNTYILEAKYGWSGICVEANPVTFEILRHNRRAECLNICLDQSEGEVDFVLRGVLGGIVNRDVDNRVSDLEGGRAVKLRTTTLNRMLEDHRAPAVIDYLSIDVEGAEERILADFDFHKYRFRCMTIERPSRLLRELFEKHGYILIKQIPGLDSFYIHSDFLDEYQKNLFGFYRKWRLVVPVWVPGAAPPR